MDVEITPEPSEEERRAIFEALAAEGARGAGAYQSPWRASSLDDLRGDAAAEDAGGDAGVVEP